MESCVHVFELSLTTGRRPFLRSCTPQERNRHISIFWDFYIGRSVEEVEA